MTRIERIRYEVLLRVRDFGKAHPELFVTSVVGQQALVTVGNAIESIETFLTDRGVAVDNKRHQLARRELIVNRMRTIARSSKHVIASSGQPLRLRMPRQKAHSAVATAARIFLKEAEAQREDFAKLGLPDTCLADLRQALDAFEAAMTDRRQGRAGIALAKKGIEHALAAGAKVVRQLDTVVRNVVGDAPVLAAWERDKKIVTWEKRTPKHDAAPATPATTDVAPGTFPTAS